MINRKIESIQLIVDKKWHLNILNPQTIPIIINELFILKEQNHLTNKIS